MYLEDSPHSHRYILLYDHARYENLVDKKYRSSAVLQERIDFFFKEAKVKPRSRREANKTLRRIYKNMRQLYGKDGSRNPYHI